MVSASEAAQSAQRRLDESLMYSPEIARAIQRVTVDGQYAVRKSEGKTLLVLGKKKEEDVFYRVAFTLELAQEPMAPAGNQAMPATALYVPPFIEDPQAVGKLVRDLSAELKAMDPDLFDKEIKALGKAAGNRDDDPGLVAFRLGPLPGGACLIARIGGNADGIFILDPAAIPRATVFKHRRAKGDTVAWAPFHRLFETIRSWQRNATALRRLEGPAPASIGGIAAGEFLTAMWSAYRDAANLLASSDAASAALPAHYVIGNMSATLTYSIPRTIGNTPDPDPPLVRSNVSICVRTASAAPVIELRLEAPEYVLVSDRKQAVIQLLSENLDADPEKLGKDSFFSAIPPELQAQYEIALRDRARAADALVLLSYQDQPPKNEFLFVWKGEIGSEERDFAFRFRLDGNRLVQPELVKGLEAPDTADVPYHSGASGVHDFFHGAWIWTIMGGWFPA